MLTLIMRPPLRVSNLQGRVVPVAPYLVQIRTTPQLPFND
jgi:hypothetical protein